MKNQKERHRESVCVCVCVCGGGMLEFKVYEVPSRWFLHFKGFHILRIFLLPQLFILSQSRSLILFCLLTLSHCKHHRTQSLEFLSFLYTFIPLHSHSIKYHLVIQKLITPAWTLPFKSISADIATKCLRGLQHVTYTN